MEPRTNPYEDQKCEAEEELERKLLAALDDGDSQEVTPEFFKQLRASVAIGREQKDLSKNLKVEGVWTNILLMRPNHRAIKNPCLLEIIFVSKLAEYAKIEQASAVINTTLPIGKSKPQLVVICWRDFTDSWVHVFYLKGSIL
jgi:hypothetical protein